MIKSISYDQEYILQSIMTLCKLDKFDVDITYGNGGFYKNIPKPAVRIDIDESLSDINHKGTSTATNLPDCSANSIVFDPPFLTYVRQSRVGNGDMIMAKRFGGYWRYDELETHYKDTLKEVHRVLIKKGVLVFKCQDIVHNHKLHSTHINAVNWAVEQGFRLKDLFILAAKNRMPIPQTIGTALKKQKHARVFHSYFLVLEKVL